MKRINSIFYAGVLLLLLFLFLSFRVAAVEYQEKFYPETEVAADSVYKSKWGKVYHVTRECVALQAKQRGKGASCERSE